MSTKYEEWKKRRQEIEREIELLTQEAKHAHDQLMGRWDVGDPAFKLNDYNLELMAKLEQAEWDLELNSKAEPKEATCSVLSGHVWPSQA